MLPSLAGLSACCATRGIGNGSLWTRFLSLLMCPWTRVVFIRRLELLHARSAESGEMRTGGKSAPLTPADLGESKLEVERYNLMSLQNKLARGWPNKCAPANCR